MEPTVLNCERNSIKSTAITILTYDIQSLAYTIDQQTLLHFSQRIQCTRSKYPIDRLSRNHQQLLLRMEQANEGTEDLLQVPISLILDMLKLELDGVYIEYTVIEPVDSRN